ncbi:cytosolic carboxypeptidase 1-like isoform X5 [Maniola hyperantus]|uniref:cytosolic carboxypeptidase 1-like isoform X5 n=1 Tax=Aphantopus hyperantus TaxID=2795564 RepID=UPI0037482852
MADDAASECLFERLRTHQQRAPDSAEVARAITARINSRLTSHANNVARQQCSQHFISINGTQVVIRTLLNIHSKRDSNVSTELMMQDLVWVLAALAPKDPKFAMKVRMLGCVRTMHLILKGHFTDTKLIFPLLVILKQLAKNSVTTSILIRDGVIGTYERVLVSLGCIPTARLRLCLDAIDYFSKNKVCCMQIVKTGLCSVLIRVFDRWDRYEGRMRLKICAHILQTMQHLCNIKAGRRALCIKKHVQTLHRFCAQCPDEIEFDGLLARVCSVITLCLKHQALPVPANSPASFNLNPILKGTNTTWPCHEDDEDGANSDSKTINSDIEDDEPDSDTENIDEYPDIDFDNETEMKAEDLEKSQITKSGESLQNALWINPNEREIEDLKRYYIYFKEFGSYNKQVRLVKSRSNSRGSILDDIFNPQTSGYRNQTSSTLSLAGGIGSTDYDTVLGLSQTYSFLQGYHKVHESTSTTSFSSLKIHKDISKYGTFASVYSTISSRVRSIIPFVKVAYPDMVGGQGSTQPEPLNKMERVACRNKLLSCVERAINPESYMNEVVYDLDALSASGTTTDSTASKSLSADNLLLNNTDEQEITKVNTFASRLSFESRFESGNLRKAIQVGPREYELILMPDVNSAKRHQWFYFEVRNMQQGRPYVFNIVNCEKSDSQFNFGMKPVMYSVKDAVLGKPGWVRVGSDICYYRNSYHYANQKNSKCYLTVTFNIEFPHTNDVCYLAYHFPFTYSMMITRIWQWSTQMPPSAYLRAEPLCYSLNNNEVPLLTITAEDTPSNPLVDREIIFLTARVHPGESNASWVMDGTLGCLLADTQPGAALRAKYVFKIVPMLNVEGVINGCHRCGLTNEDLNRRWCKPSSVLHPSIYHTKGLIEYLVRVWKKPPLVYCDYHGHSRKKNVFFYGCAGAESWCSNDRLVPDEPVKYLMLPALMHRISPAFALGSCSFRVERERESTARVTVWRHLGVTRSYTMEASFCGFDRGPFKGFHLNTQHLQSVGSDFCEALNGLGDNANGVDIQFTKDLNGNIVEIHLTGAEENSEIAVDSEPASGSDSVLKTDSDEDFD